MAAVGVKGSDVYSPEAVGDPRVVLSVKAVRDADAADLVHWHDKVLALGDEGIVDGTVLAFQSRDVRGGKGERKVFETLMRNLMVQYPVVAEAVFKLIPEYGGWMDLLRLLATPMLKDQFKTVLEKIIVDQFHADEKAVKEWRLTELSLLGKWLPREGNAQDELAKRLARVLNAASPTPQKDTGAILAAYRRRCAALNKALKTVETFECSGRWDEIEPKRVPARARELKKAAYLNEKKGQAGVLRHPEDEKRMACRKTFQDFFTAAAAGKTKISGAETLFPHEIVKKAASADTEDEANSLNAVWLQMVAKLKEKGGLENSIAMCDFSGSMMCAAKGFPYWVSKAFGLLIAAANTGPFQGQFLGFSSDPEWLKVDTSDPLTEQLKKIDTSKCEGTSTDFQKAMDKVLGTLKAARVHPGEEPKNLIVITDMGFDAACASHNYTGHMYRHHVKTAPWQTHIQAIRESFKRAGEDMWGTTEEGGLGGWKPPQIVIWNVAASYTDDFHATANEEGVALLAGWSPALFKILCEQGPRSLTPYDTLRAQLDDVRYDRIREEVKAVLQGGWREII